jgi:flagella basal body P-ring formation protein FlgA
VAQAEAAPGQLVAVRAQHSSDTLTGRLTAAGTVLIE